MSKVVDITDKLNFEESPKLVIRGELYTVNDSAEAMLKMMVYFDDQPTAKTVVEVYEILFSEEDRNRINALKLNFQDLTTIIKAAMDLVRGADDDEESPS